MNRFLFIALCFAFTPPALALEKAVVIVPIADLRSDRSLPPRGRSDDKQQTQLLQGEIVEVVASKRGWVQVHALEQPEFTTHQKWEGYPGWVQRKALSFKDLEKRHPSYPEELRLSRTSGLLRTDLMETAKRFLGTPYVWGGLSLFNKKARLSGLDCSGLVHLTYRAQGLVVPRDSMDQYLKATKLKRVELKPGDLIFSAKADKPDKVTHVVLYAGNAQILEAPQTGMVVREVSFKEKYGVEFSKTESGQTLGDRVVYFGRLLAD